MDSDTYGSDFLRTLITMGFTEHQAVSALAATDSVSIDIAVEWIFAHPELGEEPAQAGGQTEEMDTTAVQPVLRLRESASGGESSSSGPPIQAPSATRSVVPYDPAADADMDFGGDTASEPSSFAVEEIIGDSKDVNDADEQGAIGDVVKSLQCEECKKTFKSSDEVEYHAVKTGHQSFKESTEEVKPLTEEEKQAKLKALEEKLRLRRQRKEAEERREEINREKQRRKTGQELAEAKKRLEAEEMRRIAEQKRVEKQEEKLARQRVLDQIERDRVDRQLKFGDTAGIAESQKATVGEAAISASPRTYNEANIQIRLSNGSTLVHTFGAREQLAAVKLYIQLNRTDGDGPFDIMTNFPKKIFDEEDLEKPLTELGLVPSAVLFVRSGK